MLSFILWELTLQEVLSDIPHDAGAVIVYVMLALFIGFVWAGSRNKRDPGAHAGRHPGGSQGR